MLYTSAVSQTFSTRSIVLATVKISLAQVRLAYASTSLAQADSSGFTSKIISMSQTKFA
jgi:hypothetical protein